MPVSIPEDELQYWYMTLFKDEDGRMLFDVVHINNMDWRQPDFMSISMNEVYQNMKTPQGKN